MADRQYFVATIWTPNGTVKCSNHEDSFETPATKVDYDQESIYITLKDGSTAEYFNVPYKVRKWTAEENAEQKSPRLDR